MRIYSLPSVVRFVSAGSLLAVSLSLNSIAQSPPPIPPAFGPHHPLKEADFIRSKSFASSDRIVGTYYFYWYDAETKEHLVNADGSDALTTHPPQTEDFQ